MEIEKKKVLITEPIDDKGIELLKEHGYEIVMGTGIDKKTVIKEATGCQAILTRNAHIDGEIMDSIPGLKSRMRLNQIKVQLQSIQLD